MLDKLIPEIKERFIASMVKKYQTRNVVAEQISEPFIQVILDASNYGFSINHSDAYSAMGYVMAWLRYYYPLEFITANLNVNIGKQDKTTKLVEFAKSKGIALNGIKFRYSKAGYMFDKETNSVYQGIEPIKFLNSAMAEDLYKLRDRKYDSFVDLLLDIREGVDVIEIDGVDGGVTKMDYKEFLSSTIDKDGMKWINKMEKEDGVRLIGDGAVSINSRQMQILIVLNFFSEFGSNRKLLKIFHFFDSTYNPKHKLKTKRERYEKSLKFEMEAKEEALSLVEQCTSELTFLGHIETINPEMPPNILIMTEVLKHKTYTRAKAYQFATGETREFKMGSKTYAQVPFEEGDVIQIVNADVKPKNKKINGHWQPSPTEKEVWLKEIKFIRKGVSSDGE